MINRHSPKHILVLGAGPSVQAVVTRLAALPGVASVRQVGSYKAGDKLPDASLCVELLEGLSLAYEASIQAFAQGMGLVMGSPLLAVTHGALLQRAAQGQGAYLANAAHGLGNLPGLLQGLQASQLVWVPHSAAQQQVARMVARRESATVAAEQLQLRKIEMADLFGKQTHVRAHALLAAWQDVRLEPDRQARLGNDELQPEMLPILNQLGLRLAYGAIVSARGIRTGPIALPQTLALPEVGEDLVMAQTPGGELRVSLPAATGLEATVVQAVQAYLAGQRQVATMGVAAPAAARFMPQLLLAPQPIAGTPWLVEQQQQGWWGGVMMGAGPQAWPEGTLRLPVPADYRPVAAPKLRLVG